MRIRLRLLLPLIMGVVVAASFALVAATVGDAVRGSLSTVPGLTRERAVEEAVRVVALGGALAAVAAALAGLLVAWLVTHPLAVLQRAALNDTEGTEPAELATPLAEVEDLARSLRHGADELRDRHGRALREGSELASLVEAVSEGIMQVEASGRVARANPASRRLLGLPADVIGRPVASVFRSAELRDLMQRAGAGEAVDAAEVMVDNRRIFVSVSPQSDGGALATFVDLTDLRRLEEVRRDFVANASHELKTPLTSIRGYSETLLRGDVAGPERERFLETIARNAERLQRVVDDLLDLSRLEAGRWQPELEPLHALQLAASCWDDLHDPAAAADLRFETTGEGGDRVLADRRGLEQVFGNLFHNAIRHTPGGGTILVSAHSDPRGPDGTPRQGGWVRVDVADTGTGISREALPRIFERFYRVDPARSRQEGGTGLGLSIVKHIMESMGGAAGVDSVLGKGTTLHLWLPPAR